MRLLSISDLESLIRNEIEEGTELEYKSSFAISNPKWKEELAKDVSAMANSNGGIIVYGIREKESAGGHSVPIELMPIPNTEMSKDRLSQLISSNIRPVPSVNITYIEENEISGYYVLTIPQSSTVHQNKLTHIYYKRRNATVEAMEDYEIRDVMNRSKNPKIDLEFSLVQIEVDVISKVLGVTNGIGYKTTHSKRIDYKLQICPLNDGSILAKYINYFIYIPEIIIKDKGYRKESGYSIIYGDNTTRDLMEYNGFQKKYGPSRYDPILPDTKGQIMSIALDLDNKTNIDQLPPIKYSIHADNAPVVQGEVDWKKVKVIHMQQTENDDPFNP